MREIVEKGFLVGLGALSLTKERAERVVDDLVKRGEVSRDDAGKLTDRLVARGKEERAEVRRLAQDEVRKTLGKMDLATRSDLLALTERVDRLAEKLAG